MAHPERSACVRCAVTGNHGGPLCRRCRIIGGLKFTPAPRCPSTGVLPAAFQYLATVHQLGCVAILALFGLALPCAATSGPLIGLLMYLGLRLHAVHQTRHARAAGWWAWMSLTIFDGVFAFESFTLGLLSLISLTLLMTVRHAAVEPPARGVPVRVSALRSLHGLAAAALVYASSDWGVPALGSALAWVAAAAQFVVPALVVGCGGHGWRWWLALCGANLVAGALAVAHHGPLSCIGEPALVLAAIGVTGLAVLTSETARTWGRATELHRTILLALPSLLLNGLGLGVCLTKLIADGDSGTPWIGLAYFSCGLLGVLGTLEGDRRCWMVWRATCALNATALAWLAIIVGLGGRVPRSSPWIAAALLVGTSGCAMASLATGYLLGSTAVRAGIDGGPARRPLLRPAPRMLTATAR